MSAPHSWRFDPTPCGFPTPRVPVLAPATRSQLQWHANPIPPGVTRFARGRYALLAAYRACGVGPGAALLAPAYHCRTMFDPAVQLGAEVALYPLSSELNPDLDGLRVSLRASRTRPAALLFTHFFGMPRDIAPVAAWCRDEGIALVEDCSHALVMGPETGGAAACANGGMGRVGRYATSSPYKFFPCADGGWLWPNDPASIARPPRGRRSPLDELRALRSLGRQLWHAAPGPSLRTLDQDWAEACRRATTTGRDWIDDSGAVSADYRSEDQDLPSLCTSDWLQRHTAIAPLLERRRHRWQQWADATHALAGCRGLLPALPAGSTPYMYPLLVDDPAAAFYPLKQLGLPIQRWDDMAISDCPISRRYRQGLFHLPCHQALGDQDMAWMIGAVGRALGRAR